MEADLAKMRRYMLHHRIATYAIVLFLVLITFILISISKQVENEQALTLDSQAAGNRTQSQTMGRQGTCPANGMPARLMYNGSSSCYFGQYRSVSVRCNNGDRAQIIDASSTGTYSVCADKSVLEAAAKARCGCTDAVPTTAPTGLVFPTVIQSTPVVINPTLGLKACKTGVLSVMAATVCQTDEDLLRSASYTCLNGKQGVIDLGKNNCKTLDRITRENVGPACAAECNIRLKPLPTN